MEKKCTATDDKMIQQVEHKNYLKKNTNWKIVKIETSKSEKDVIMKSQTGAMFSSWMKN